MKGYVPEKGDFVAVTFDPRRAMSNAAGGCPGCEYYSIQPTHGACHRLPADQYRSGVSVSCERRRRIGRDRVCDGRAGQVAGFSGPQGQTYRAGFAGVARKGAVAARCVYLLKAGNKQEKVGRTIFWKHCSSVRKIVLTPFSRPLFPQG